jgi:hypothetical protein
MTKKELEKRVAELEEEVEKILQILRDRIKEGDGPYVTVRW